MDELLGKLEAEVPIYSDAGEGKLLLHEKGLVYYGPEVNGKVVSLYSYVEGLEVGRDLPLGKKELVLSLLSVLGEKFRLRFGISEHYVHVLREKCGKK